MENMHTDVMSEGKLKLGGSTARVSKPSNDDQNFVTAKFLGFFFRKRSLVGRLHLLSPIYEDTLMNTVFFEKCPNI